MTDMKQAIDLYVDDGGTGRNPLLFVHSLAGNTGQWEAQLQHVRRTRRAAAVDLRGHGRSPFPENGAFAIESMADDLHFVVEEMGDDQVVLVGHSMGGLVAVAYAGAHSDRVAGLLLLDPSGDSTRMSAEDVAGYMGALQSDAYQGFIEGYWSRILAGATKATAAQVMADLRETRRETVVGAFGSLFAYDPLPALGRYAGPKLSLITPLNETPVSLHNLDSSLPIELIEGTGHWLQMDKPDLINRHLDHFLESRAL